MKIFIITKYSYYTIFTISILILGISFCFLYNNFYQTLIQARIIYILKNQVAFESVNMQLWDKVTQNLENKKTSTLSGLSSVNDGIPKLFIEYFKHINEWSDERLKYSFGERTEGVKIWEVENELSEAEQQPATFKTGNWRNRIRISRKAPEIWDVENPDRNTEWGNLVHFIMSKIITKKDVSDVLDEIEMQGFINAFEKETLWRKVNKLVSNPKISSFYKPGIKVLNEQDILVKDGKTFRPDRLIIIDDKIVIIDYKTGKEENYHIKQLNNYESLIKKMGYQNVEKYLFYLDEEKILKVS